MRLFGPAMFVAALVIPWAILWAGAGTAQTYQEAPMLAEQVAAGTLPPVAERLPETPATIVPLSAGTYGGEIEWLAGRARDIRIMNAYGYARLVGFDADLNLVADILESYEVEEGRIFTFHLRPGLRWSDGEPFTTEDFRYEWFDVQLNTDLRPFGPDPRLLIDGERPEVEIIDDYTVRYSWSEPNPRLIPALAGALPLYLYAPAHYLRQFHKNYADPDELAAEVAAAQLRDWTVLHIRRGNLYEAHNPDLPVLQPWVVATPAPSQRFRFVRNPYYHRVDDQGQQLPYLDNVYVNVSDPSLIAVQTGTGASDLQARHIRIEDYAFLAQAEDTNQYYIDLWETVRGSEIAIYPNLTAADPVWRELLQDVRFRRALSLAVYREEINEIIYFGLGELSNNTVVPASPFWTEELATAWTQYDLDQANELLDEIGLTDYHRGIRLLPDGRRLEITVETSGERREEVDALQLIADGWRSIGVAMSISNSQRDLFRNRIFAGETIMSVWFGLDNGLITPTTVPTELAPVDQNWLQYPAWGQYWQTAGVSGQAPDLPWAQDLVDLYSEWLITTDRDRKIEIVTRMLAIHADQVTSIGLVQGLPQPIVVADRLHNVPLEAVYSWNPGAHFGRYRTDTFWVDPQDVN